MLSAVLLLPTPPFFLLFLFCCFCGFVLYSSIMAWAFAPPNPKEFTPISKGFFEAFKDVSEVTTDNLSPSKSIWGFGSLKCNDGGMVLFFKLNITLSKPAIPDAVSRCPKFVLAEPIGSGFLRFRPKTLASAAASSGSPTAVPVP